MPFIPTVQSEIGARSLRSSNALPQTRASGEAFGAGIGRALQGFAGDLDAAAGSVAAYQERKRQETVANTVAQSDFTPRELEIRTETPANGEGYRERVLSEYRSFVDTEADKIEDNVARAEYKRRMMAQEHTVSARSATFEYQLSTTHSKEQASASIMALDNKILSDPTMYDNYVQQGYDVLDTRTDIPAALREGMKTNWKQNSAKSRFTGMLERASTVEEIDAIAAELAGTGGSAAGPDERAKDWTKEFAPQDFQSTMNLIGTARKAIVTKADTDARAALDTLEARAADVTALIPREELAAVQSVVKQSQNPITVSRMARLTRDQDIIRESQSLTPAEIRGRINATNQNPGVAYPGVPPRVSSAINSAVEKFDISASYLGGTVQREYGMYLKTGKRGQEKFAPVSLRPDVDLRSIRSDVADAAAVAGELYGAPLQITSGYRSQGKQDAIRAGRDTPGVAKHSNHTEGTGLDVSTVGMAPADKARLVGSLVDAGFTGIGEYGTHVHADFREAVPSSFGERDGKVWGGWTFLSPEVAKSLADRGFAADLSAQQIQRAAPVTTLDEIDYGRGTSATKDDGRPATSATGVMQATEGTFLGILKKPGMAARMGVDITGKSDAEILELRKNPEVSIMFGAALAEENKHTLTQTLGRGVSDAEVYMAHLLGGGGAVSLIKAMEKQPEQSASALMPEAAKNNYGLFHDKNRRVLTVRELYGKIATTFASEPTRVAHGDNETRKKFLDNQEKQLASDPVAFAQSTGTLTVSPLDPAQGFAQRGAEARSIADYYSIPIQDMKPFTEDEANSFVKSIKDGDVDDVLEAMTAIQSMGGDMTRAALKQIDQKDSVFAYAAGLQFERGQGSVASDIVRGQKRIEENPEIKQSIGAEPRDLYDAFTKASGGALFGIAPEQRQAIQEAATAHYIETVVARGATTSFNQDMFTNSVQAVMGGMRGAPAIADVNGAPTVLPPGMTGEEMESALQRMTIDDWTKQSDSGLPPRYVTGDIIAPDDMADEAVLQTIGGGKYRVMLADGSYAVTGRAGPNGRMEAYIFSPKPEALQKIATRPLPSSAPYTSTPAPRDTMTNQDENLTVEEQQRLRENYGPLHQFDENGRWIGPAK